MRFLEALIGTIFVIASSTIIITLIAGIFFLTRWVISIIFFVDYNSVSVMTTSIIITLLLFTYFSK